MAPRNKAKVLHPKRITRQEKKDSKVSRISNRRGNPETTARLILLESILVSELDHDASPLAQIESISNPRPRVINNFPAGQVWWETYRTTNIEAVNQVLWLAQEIIFGVNILSSKSTEEEARHECYELSEEVDGRLVGLMPELPNTSIIFPIYDIDAFFTQMEESGVFTLTKMFTFTWKVAKRRAN